MKKLLIAVLVLAALLCCGCGAQAPAATPTPEPTATPEPTPSVIEMDCALTDVLDADQQAFLSSIKSDPPAAAVIYLDGQYPETVVLDIDAVRSLCSALTDMTVSAELMETSATAENYLTLARESGESITVNFLGDELKSMDSVYSLENADAFWTLLRDTCEKSMEDAAAVKEELSAEDAETVVYEDESKWWMMRCTHTPLEKVGTNEDCWQTARTTLSLTNTGEHLIMSVKLQVKYINADGYVVADVPVDLDFNTAPIYLGECREYILDEKIYNLGGESSEALAATDMLITVVSVNAPNEAGH